VISWVLHRTDCISYSTLVPHIMKTHHGVKVWIHALTSALVSGHWSASCPSWFIHVEGVHGAYCTDGWASSRYSEGCGVNKHLCAYHKSVATHPPVTTPSWTVTLHLRTLMIHKNRPSSQIFLVLTQCHWVSGSVKGWAVRKESPSWSARPLKMKHYVPSKCQESLPQWHYYNIQKDLNPQTPLWN